MHPSHPLLFHTTNGWDDEGDSEGDEEVDQGAGQAIGEACRQVGREDFQSDEDLSDGNPLLYDLQNLRHPADYLQGTS
jgi:hypothetical protein